MELPLSALLLIVAGALVKFGFDWLLSVFN